MQAMEKEKEKEKEKEPESAAEEPFVHKEPSYYEYELESWWPKYLNIITKNTFFLGQFSNRLKVYVFLFNS